MDPNFISDKLWVQGVQQEFARCVARYEAGRVLSEADFYFIGYWCNRRKLHSQLPPPLLVELALLDYLGL